VKNIVVTLLVTILISVGLHAQTQKTGFVNSTKIFQELPEAQEAQKKIEALTKPYADSAKGMEDNLKGKYEEYQKKEALMTEVAKKAAQQELVELERKYNEYRTDKFGADGSLAKQTDKIIGPLKEKIIKAIERVAKEEKYSFVFDQTEQVKVLLYADRSQDLTYKVIDHLKRGK
jgi:outer membrane protein